MRQVVLDTETTGLSPKSGHRIIEIGCVELIDGKRTGNLFHSYINPCRLIDVRAMAVHGITDESLKDKPKFEEISGCFLNFIDGDELIIHNAPFDLRFLDHELSLIDGDMKIKNKIFDTLSYAREKYPGEKHSLDALCVKFGADNSFRTLHGALLDAEVLVDVYNLLNPQI
jgi:DNA polymerase-3 subunit epsilon